MFFPEDMASAYREGLEAGIELAQDLANKCCGCIVTVKAHKLQAKENAWHAELIKGDVN